MFSASFLVWVVLWLLILGRGKQRKKRRQSKGGTQRERWLSTENVNEETPNIYIFFFFFAHAFTRQGKKKRRKHFCVARGNYLNNVSGYNNLKKMFHCHGGQLTADWRNLALPFEFSGPRTFCAVYLDQLWIVTNLPSFQFYLWLLLRVLCSGFLHLFPVMFSLTCNPTPRKSLKGIAVFTNKTWRSWWDVELTVAYRPAQKTTGRRGFFTCFF